MAVAALSIVDYIFELRQAGFTEKQSEVQARRLEQVVFEVKQEIKQEIKQEFQIHDLATKQDVKAETSLIRKEIDLAIEKLRHETLKFVVWTGVGVVVFLGSGLITLGTMIAKGFHWV